ncbi:hypothetical protein GQX74_012715 [Glossina fuscipes]|nr:hypothetical protein GQX74_012715 [Glossina fuscipes]
MKMAPTEARQHDASPTPQLFVLTVNSILWNRFALSEDPMENNSLYWSYFICVASMFNGLNLDNVVSEDGNMFLPFMEGMMKTLLSAEILLPSIKELILNTDICEKLTVEEKARYGKQLERYKVTASHLENENANDTLKEKHEKFKIVLEDIRKLQDCSMFNRLERFVVISHLLVVIMVAAAVI